MKRPKADSPGTGANGLRTDPLELEARLAEARKAREVALARKNGASDAPEGASRPAARKGWERRIREARAQRDKALAEAPAAGAETAQPDAPHLETTAGKPGPARKAQTVQRAFPFGALSVDEDLADPPQEMDERSGTPLDAVPDSPQRTRKSAIAKDRPRPVPRWVRPVRFVSGAVAAAVACVVLLALLPAVERDGISANVPAKPSADTAADLATVEAEAEPEDAAASEVSRRGGTMLEPAARIVVIAETPNPARMDALGIPSAEWRLTPFEVLESSVHFFNDEDAETAAELATMIDGKAVDLRGMQPPQPVGTFEVYLTSD